MLHDFTERLQLGQRVRIHLWHSRCGFLDSGENLHPLDRVDAQIRFEVHLGREHLRRVAGFVRDHGRHHGTQVDRRDRGNRSGDHWRCRNWSRGGRRCCEGRLNGHRNRRGHRSLHRGQQRGHGALRDGRSVGRRSRLGRELRTPAEHGHAALHRLQERGVALRHRVEVRRVGLGGVPLSFLPKRPPPLRKWCGLGFGVRGDRRHGERRSDGRSHGMGRSLGGHGFDLGRSGSRSRSGRLGRRGRRGSCRHSCNRLSPLGVGWWVVRRSQGWIRLAVVGTGQAERKLRLRGGERVIGQRVASPQRVELQLVAVRQQGGETIEESPHSVASLAVQVQRAVRTVAQDPSDQAGEHRPWPDLDERADAGFKHRLDHLDEADRLGQLRGELSPDRRRLCGVRRGGCVGEDRNPRLAERRLLQRSPECFRRARDHLGVECRRDGQPGTAEPLLTESLLDILDRRRLPGKHDLLRRVVVGYDHVGAEPFDRFPHDIHTSADSRHGAGNGRGLGHRLTARTGHVEEGVGIENTRGVQRRDLTKAVSGHARRREADGRQQIQHRQAGAANGRLRDVRRRQPSRSSSVRIILEVGDREHGVVQPHPQPCSPVPGAQRPVEVHGELCPHVDVLAALAREHEPDVALGRTVSVAGARGRREGFRTAELNARHRVLKLLYQPRFVGSHDREPMRPGPRPIGPASLPRQRSGFGASLRHCPGLIHQRLGAVGCEQDQLVSHGSQPRRTAARRGHRSLLERHVEVRASKTECADRSATRVLGATDPRAGACRDVEG